MKSILVLLAVIAMAASDMYDPRYDNFNAKEVVGNVRALKGYGNCFIDKGPCTSEGSDFKKLIPDALETKCSKCSPKQRELIREVSNGFKHKLPQLWDKILGKFDPTNRYHDQLEEYLQEH